VTTVDATIGGEHPGPAGIGHHGDPAADQVRLAGKDSGGADQLAEAFRGDDPGLLEQRFAVTSGVAPAVWDFAAR
jgi:hypothetical protein